MALEKNLTIIKQLLERVDKINKAFKTGKEMLQTVRNTGCQSIKTKITVLKIFMAGEFVMIIENIENHEINF